jgi:tripartite-type tricarboxylate transporter receptor subunit TctC
MFRMKRLPGGLVVVLRLVVVFRLAVVFLTSLSLLSPWAASCALAQYPAKAVKIIVPFTPASATDILGRVVADQLSK